MESFNKLNINKMKEYQLKINLYDFVIFHIVIINVIAPRRSRGGVIY